MWTAIKRIVKFLALILLIAFLHYNLPHRDIVKISGTDIKRMDIKEGAWGWDRPDAGTDHNTMRDVRFINAVRENGKPRVYRNEDTDWGWPPYFKFDSSDLNAKAQELARNNSQWVAIYHYGWRLKWLSVYPNAYKIRKVSGPDTVLIPWLNIIIIAILIFLYFWIRRWFKVLRNNRTRRKD